MVGRKKQDFWPKIIQRNCCILWIDLIPGPQNVPKLYVLSKSLYFVKNFFFSTPIFLKLCPIFVASGLGLFTQEKDLPWIMLIFWKRYCFLGAPESRNSITWLTLTDVQVNLCQELLFLHQLTHNMTTDFSMNCMRNGYEKFSDETIFKTVS